MNDIINSTLNRISINPTELCNRTCPFCPRGDSKVYPNRNLHMSSVVAKKIGQDAKDISFTGELSIAGYGEPLLHNNLPEIVKHMTNDNDFKDVQIITNGDFLTHDTMKQLISAGVTRFVVSLYDGSHQREKIMNIAPEDVQIIFRDRYYSLGLSNKYGNPELNNRCGLVNDMKIVETINKPCYIPFNKCMIDWNGDVLLCDPDWSRDAVFGNIIESSIQDLWMSDKMKEYRVSLMNSKRCLSPCDKCDVSGDVYGKESFDILSDYYRNHK